ncbi:MAG TPA: cyclic nucleotide-binding domain-containing protein [Acidimicrobiia bacterium]|nr:cyclic nucleotide-binding domain-containing protein [Acidimicrobiia bacterium]
MSELEARLSAHPFVQGVERESLDSLIAAAVGIVEWEPETIVARTGSFADRCYLVERGDLAIEVHRPGRRPRIIQTVNDGEVLGWSWVVEPYRWTFDVRALTPSTAIALDGVALRSAMEADHELGYLVLRRFAMVIAGRLEATRLQLLDVYGARD